MLCWVLVCGRWDMRHDICYAGCWDGGIINMGLLLSNSYTYHIHNIYITYT